MISQKTQNIGFSTNGEGKNRILDPKGKNSCPSGEATRARNFSLRGQEFYSCPSHWLRILFLRISNRVEAFSRKNLSKSENLASDFTEKSPPGQEFFTTRAGISVLARVVYHPARAGISILARVVRAKTDFLAL